MIDEHWMIHKMVTTNNFARDNTLLCWHVGGLNFQIEHHLFPRIYSVYYRISVQSWNRQPKNLASLKTSTILFGAVASYYPYAQKLGTLSFPILKPAYEIYVTSSQIHVITNNRLNDIFKLNQLINNNI